MIVELYNAVTAVAGLISIVSVFVKTCKTYDRGIQFICTGCISGEGQQYDWQKSLEVSYEAVIFYIYMYYCDQIKFLS